MIERKTDTHAHTHVTFTSTLIHSNAGMHIHPVHTHIHTRITIVLHLQLCTELRSRYTSDQNKHQANLIFTPIYTSTYQHIEVQMMTIYH